MKSYTDLQQSKVLAEILPLESADMVWKDIKDGIIDYCADLTPYELYSGVGYPAWSLSALLDYLKQKFYVRLSHDGVSWGITCFEHDTRKEYNLYKFDEQVDACWGMILRLNKEGLL